MEELRELLSIFLSEWRKTLPHPESPFAAVPGLGTLQAEYARANWPSWVKILIAVGMCLFAFYTTGPFTDNILFVFGVFWALNILMNWSGRTPRQVALFSGGIAWLEQRQIQTLDWKQIKAARQKSNSYIVETTGGQLVVFHLALQGADIGKAIRANVSSATTSQPKSSITGCFWVVAFMVFGWVIGGMFGGMFGGVTGVVTDLTTGVAIGGAIGGALGGVIGGRAAGEGTARTIILTIVGAIGGAIGGVLALVFLFPV